jgi:hypothetical protein
MIEMQKQEMQYPSKWIYGKPKGSISTKETYVMARFYDKYKALSFDKNNENDIKEKRNLAVIWIIQESEKLKLMHNQFRFIDENTIEVKCQNDKTFICDLDIINKIQKYNITCITKHSTKKEYINFKKNHQAFGLTQLLKKFVFAKFKDGNSLNLKLENIIDAGNKYENSNIEDVSINFKLFEENKPLPKNKFILGKPSTNPFKRGTCNSWVCRFSYKDENEEKKKEDKSFNNENDAKKWNYNISNFRNVIKEKIMIVGNYIAVDLGNNQYMITDSIFLKLIQLNNISIYTSHERPNCNILFNKDIKLFHQIITGFKVINHLNDKFLDNRLINLHSKRNDKSDDDLIVNNNNFTVKCSRYREKINEVFEEKKYGEQAKELAYNLLDLISTINYDSYEIKFIEKYNNNTLKFICNLYEKIKSNITDYNTDLFSKYNTGITEEDIKLIQEYQNNITKKKKEILDSKIKQLKNILNKKEIKDNTVLCKDIPFNETLFKKNIEQPIIINYKDKEEDKEENTEEDKNNDEEKENDDINSDNEFDSDDEIETDEKNEANFDNLIDCNIRYISEIFDYSKSPNELIKQYDEVLNTKIPEDINYYDVFCELVKDKGGMVISKKEEYKTTHHKLKVKCLLKHEFSTTLNNLRHDRWCPLCSSCKMEKLTKFIVEFLLKNKFEKIKPKWLEGLELDMYCEEKKLAFEYNGVQHYKFIKHFHRTENALEKQKERDKKKVKLCEENKIKLIVIPYNYDKIYNIKDYPEFIKYILKENKIKFTDKNVPKMDPLEFAPQVVKNIFKKIKENNFEIKDYYYESNKKSKFVVKYNDYYYEGDANEIMNLDFNSIIKNNIKDQNKIKNKQKIKDIIQEKEGKIIDGTYVTVKSLFTIECKNKHQWTTKATNIIHRESWCFECSKIKAREFDQERAKTLKDWLQTDEGKKNKTKSHQKRSVTMQKEKDELRKKVQEAGVKICNRCKGYPKPLSNFGIKNDGKDGYQPWCKTCINEFKREKKLGK